MASSITPQELLNAYRQGYFPMAMQRDDPELYWFNPELRGVMPLDDRFHIPRSVQKFWRNHPFTVTINQDFESVIRSCGDVRDETWINPEIIALYTELHRLGYAHSVECWGSARHCDSKRSEAGSNPEEVILSSWIATSSHTSHETPRDDNKTHLLGGIYGIAIGSAFFGESMFSRVSGASKIALITLVNHLRQQGFTLFDTQYVNDHLQQFGVLEVPRVEYLEMLQTALEKPANFAA